MMNKLNIPAILLAIVAIVACAPSRTITVQMSNAEGLSRGNSIVMAGVIIGRVSDVKVRAGRAIVDGVVTDDEAFPNGREVAFLLTKCGPTECLRGYDIGPLTPSSGRPVDFYRGTASRVELVVWMGRATVEDWWRATADRMP